MKFSVMSNLTTSNVKQKLKNLCVPVKTAQINRTTNKAILASKFAFTKNMYTIKRGSQTVGMTDSHGRRFIIGFSNPSTARYVMTVMHPQPDISLKRSMQLNVSDEVNTGLGQMGVGADFLVSDLTLDLDAEVVIPKFVNDEKMDNFSSVMMADGGFHMSAVPSEDFLSYPFSHMVGIIIVTSTKNESKNNFVFSTMVVDPSFNVGMIRSQLITGKSQL